MMEKLIPGYIGGIDYSNEKDFTVAIKLDTKEFQEEVKEINEELTKLSERYQGAIERLKREGIKVVM